MLKYRILTALILVPLVLAILFFTPPLGFCLALSVLTLGAAWEWSNLMGLQKISHRIFYLAVVFVALFNSLYIQTFIILSTAFVWWLFAAVLVIAYPRYHRAWSQGVLVRGAMGLFVLIPSWAALSYIRSQNEGIYAILFLFFLIWGADTAAYFSGKLFGKTKLAPAVSPGKSREGLYGALIYSVFFTLIILWITQAPTSIWIGGVILAVITVLFSVLGDLFESMLKRQIGIKDSGRLLPGHGGLLDRIDSLTAAAPTFAFGALLLGMYVS